MYNQIPFQDVMNIVEFMPLVEDHCPNPKRSTCSYILEYQVIMKKIYDKMADTIYSTIESKLLGKEYSYEYTGHNLGAVPLKEISQKVIISVDRSNPLFEETTPQRVC